MVNKTILITGVSGLLGGNLALTLADQGYFVKGLIRSHSINSLLSHPKIDLVFGDLSDEASLYEMLQNVDLVIHAAANTSMKANNLDEYIQINLVGTQNIIRAAQKAKVGKFIYVSTANTFGFGTKDHPGNELKKFPSFLKDAGYPYSKYLAQQWVLREAKSSTMSISIINPTFMIGAYDHKPSSGKIILMAMEKRFVFCPPGGKNFVSVDDVAQVVCNAIDYGKSGECYLAAGINLTYKEFYQKLINVTGQKSWVIVLPTFLIKFVGKISSAIEAITGKPKLLNYSNARMICLGNYFTAQKAIKELKMPQTPIEEAIGNAIRWFRARA